MRRFSILLQWAVVLALGVLLARPLWRPVPAPDYAPDTWSAWRGFHALSYAGVTRDGGGDYVTPRRLASHLRALRDAGYRAIAPEDAEAFLQGRAPLPEKAVLILFEGGRRDSYLAATPPLREFGQIATLCVPTDRTRRWGSFYLRNRDLKKLAAFAHWRLMSMGHAAAFPIPVEGGIEGRFLTQRRAVNGRVETTEEFRARIEDDFARAATILSKAARRPVAGYLVPFADAGTSRDADPDAAAFIRDAMRKHHRIAFTRADGAFNGPDSDPFELTRIRVRGDWDARTLLDELEAAGPADHPIPDLGDLSRWTTFGDVRRTDDGLLLQPPARAWARGSSDWSDFDCSLRITRAPGGAVAFYARYAGPSRFIRLRIDDDGLRVQERTDAGLHTIAFHAAANGAPTNIAFTLRVKGNRLWLSTPDDAFKEPLPLARSAARGRLGIEADGAASLITEFEARPISPLLVRAPSFRALPPRLQTDMTAWSPVWFDLRNEPHVTPEMRDELRAASDRGVQVIPRIVIDQTEDGPQKPWADALARALSDAGAPPSSMRVSAPVGHPLLIEALRRSGFRLMQEFNADRAILEDTAGRLAREGDHVLIDGRAPGAARAIEEMPKHIPASRLYVLGDAARPRSDGLQAAIEIE